MLTKHSDFHGSTEWTLRLSDHQLVTMDHAKLWMLQMGLGFIESALKGPRASPPDTGRERPDG